MALHSVGTPALWIGFLVFVCAMLALDLGVFHRHPHAITTKEALGWSAAWISLAALFNVGLYMLFGAEHALEFTAGYLIEKALAVDNIFVFMVVFRSFAVPKEEQHRVLFWGVLGALVMRAAFIFAGGAFLQRFHWAMYVFGGLLLLTGVRLLFNKQHDEPHPENSPVLRFFSRIMPATPEFSGDHFTLVKEGKRYATPLLLALVAIEVSDVIFALDSIPAIFAVTTDPFLVFTSNIFAILGLRSLYFVLADVVDRFVYLKPALAFVLIFVGVKMCIVDFYKVPIPLSLGVIIGILVLAVLASMWRKAGERREQREVTTTP
ncbi:MAG TPA: TerC family protein [Polyangiales bacterium]|nr:TerC family protein [Polyangiales bacterium]